MTEENQYGCGRSPIGKCVGLHFLSEEVYEAKRVQKK